MKPVRLALAALAIAASGCVCSTPQCDATLCPGCCDRTGVCRPGTSQVQCGSAGNSCSSCVSGEACREGACVQTRVVPDGGSCDGIECMRGTQCDAIDGVCRCGGTTCGADQFCDGGSCVSSNGDGGLRCDFQTCRGCCITGDTCALGTSLTACGTNGQACAICPSGAVCNFGFCSQTQTGDAGCFNCFGGCCQNGFCLPGDSPSACGRGGGLCLNCGSMLTCSNGTCQVPCSSMTCAGCCDPFNMCTAGMSDFQCGPPGGQCANCASLGGHCDFDAGQCVVPCSQRCGNGCCDGDVCIPTAVQTAARCGKSGNACRGCSGPSTCDLGVCTNPDGGSCSTGWCSGCCDTTECRPHDQDSSCGFIGGLCTACDAGFTCQGGTCLPAVADGGCNASSCPTGCCSGGACVQPTFDPSYCGTAGAQCTGCDNLNGQRCLNGACLDGFAGSKCVDDAGCASFLTCRTAGGFAGGYCTASCSDAGTCLLGNATCAGGLCLKQCFAQTDCRADYRCLPVVQAPLAAKVCKPSCDNPGATCPGGTTCQPTGLCQ